MSIALRYTSNHHDAEEVLNDTFMKIFNHLKKYDSNHSMSAWISRITTNTCIDYHRKKRKTVFFLELEDQHTQDHVEAHLENMEIDQTKPILPILQQLSPQYRIVFNLYVFEEYSHKEISEKLNISIGTSKSNYSRAKKIIKEAILKDASFKHLQKSVV